MTIPSVFSLQKDWVLDSHHDPPVYTRPLIGSELVSQRCATNFDGHTELCLGINFTSSLKADELADRARRALDKLRFVCPIVACDIEDAMPPRWVYTPSTNREAWLDQALVVQHQGESLSSSKFILSIDMKRLPYVDGNGAMSRFRSYLLTTEGKEYGLYFHGSHSMFDAASGFRALNFMLEWMSGEGINVGIEPLEEWKNLPVDPITATGGPPPAWESTGPELLREFAVQRGRQTPLNTLMPSTHPSDISVPQFHHVTTVFESDTAAIIAKTKQLGISVTTLFHVAHFLACLKMNPRPEVAEIYFPGDEVVIDLDRYFKPPIDSRAHVVSALGLIPTGFSMAGPLSERTDKARLIASAKLLQAKFDKYLAHPCVPHVLSVMASMMPAEMKSKDDVVINSDGKTARFAPWSGMIQNLGNMEKKIRKEYGLGKIITVENIGIGARSPTRLRVHMWTMHSKFHIQIQGAIVWGKERMKTLVEDMLKMAMLILDESPES